MTSGATDGSGPLVGTAVVWPAYRNRTPVAWVMRARAPATSTMAACRAGAVGPTRRALTFHGTAGHGFQRE